MMKEIDDVVKQGRTVISGEDSAIVELGMKAIESGKTITLYTKPSISVEIIRRRVRAKPSNAKRLQPVTLEEVARVKADFQIDIDGWSSTETCPRCGSAYGMYEFIQQGIEEHGEEAVKAALSLEHASILQINPKQNIICRGCGINMALYVLFEEEPIGHSYEYNGKGGKFGYGCCE